MELYVQLDGEGFLPDAFGKFCAPADRDGERLCRRSFPFSLTGLPQGTRAVAWVLLDWDSVPVCGFPWIHWCGVLSVAAGSAEVSVLEDASRRSAEGLRRGAAACVPPTARSAWATWVPARRTRRTPTRCTPWRSTPPLSCRKVARSGQTSS